MIFEKTPIDGVWLIRSEPIEDERGSFTRTFSDDEFRSHGIDARVSQCSVSRNPVAGTLRGIHLQMAPHGETKLVRCIRGSIFDVAVDLRSESSTFGAHFGVRLTASNDLGLLIPPGVGHGFLTLEPETDLWYQMSTEHVASAGGGVRWDDPDLSIEWPAPGPVVMSERDRSMPSLREARASGVFG